MNRWTPVRKCIRIKLFPVIVFGFTEERMTEEKQRDEQEFSFVKEKIKRQPLYQNKTFRRAVLQLLLAALCGVVACFVFVAARPFMEKALGQKEKTAISIPKEDEEETQQEAEAEQQEPVVITEEKELELEDYRKLFGKLRGVSDAASKSMVTVTAAISDTDWFNETYESRSQTSGLLVGNNGVEILILTSYSRVQNADRLQASFVDGTSLSAVLKTYDKVKNLAVLSVNLADVQESTMETIQMAELGSSKSLKPGEPVIAVGSPAGAAGSVKFGNLTVTGHKANMIDGEYSLLVTDMERSEEASGVLLNLDGQVVGLIEDTYLDANNEEVLTAYAISDMKTVIEHLSNSQDIVYMGIHGTQVTEEISEKQQIPPGVYVSGVEAESPALNGGIQPGDIITEINGQAVASLEEIQEMLLKFSKEQVIQVKIMRQGREGYKEIMCSVKLDVLE